MGLLDVLNGMMNGPRGPSAAPSPDTGSSSGGGMSPLTMAILAMLAYKAVKHFSGSNAPAGQTGGTTANQISQQSPGQIPASTSADSGGLSDLLKGGLGGLLAGGAVGTVLSGGIGDLLNKLQQSGQGNAANSWVSNKTPNQAIAPDDLANALGADNINALMSRTGLSREELLNELSEHLPDAVNAFTPEGHVPTEKDISRWL